MLCQSLVSTGRVLRVITGQSIPLYVKVASPADPMRCCWFSSKIPNKPFRKHKEPHEHVASKTSGSKKPTNRAKVLNVSVWTGPAKTSKSPVSKPNPPDSSPEQNIEIADETIYTRQYPNGDVYVGQLSAANKHHGQGTITYANGGTWKGEFVKGKQYTGSGYSIINAEMGLSWSHGYYEGSLVAGIRQGWGKMVFDDGSYWEGEFRNGKGVTGKGYVPSEDGSAECVEKVDGIVVSRTLIPASEVPR